MSLEYKSHPHYQPALGLMETMIGTSQRPAEEDPDERGNLDFVFSLGAYLERVGVRVSAVDDPEYANRKLLIATFGDPNGEQLIANISHSDVVGVDDQKDDWLTDPRDLAEQNGLWIARGVCDTHGSGVAMLLAGQDAELQETLKRNKQKVDVIFTYDEEAPDAYWSFRGARVAAGLEGGDPVVTGRYFIAGEPTEVVDGQGMIPRRAHKGRFLFGYTVTVPGTGHAAERSQNAMTHAIEIGHRIIELSNDLETRDYGEVATIFEPGYSTAQITGAQVKDGALSTTPGSATFFVDLRTLPDFHEAGIGLVEGILEAYRLEHGGSGLQISQKAEDSFEGTETPADSPIVTASADATGNQAIGFNGGDEGAIMRRIGCQGVTLGPGALTQAHSPNEQIRVESVLDAVDVYRTIFQRLASEHRR